MSQILDDLSLGGPGVLAVLFPSVPFSAACRDERARNSHYFVLDIST
jgi:hypothetical protein